MWDSIVIIYCIESAHRFPIDAITMDSPAVIIRTLKGSPGNLFNRLVDDLTITKGLMNSAICTVPLIIN